jgi:cytochrome c oxidase subunit IV
VSSRRAVEGAAYGTEWKVFGGAGLFCAVVAVIYWLTSYEEAGTAMLTLAAGALLFVAVYLRIQAPRVGARPADRPDADPADGAGEVAYFPDRSIWPLVMGIGVVVVANAFVFGVWLALVGGLLFFTSVLGYAMEARV